MRVCIVGAGAIGGWIGARLASSGVAVSALARGATLDALNAHGWRLRTADGEITSPAHSSDDPRALGVHDLVIIAVKGQSLPALAPTLGPLIGPDTCVLPAMNGVPWWFCASIPGVGDAPLASVDPGGVITAAIPFERVLGGVVHASTAILEPGLVQHRMGQGIIVGEPQGGRSPRAQAVVDLLAAAGFEATHSEDIRRDAWFKLWGNLTMNPVSAITGATADRILADPLVRAFCSRAMVEAAEIGARIGCPIAMTPDERHAVTAKLGSFRTSMLQDAEAGRAIELDAIVAAVVEIGARVGVPTPNVDALMGLTRLFGQVRGIYPER